MESSSRFWMPVVEFVAGRIGEAGCVGLTGLFDPSVSVGVVSVNARKMKGVGWMALRLLFLSRMHFDIPLSKGA